MNIETTKLELMHLLLQTQRESILTKIKKVFEEEQTDWFNDMSNEEQEEIQNGLKQAEDKKFITNEKVMEHFKKCL